MVRLFVTQNIFLTICTLTGDESQSKKRTMARRELFSQPTVMNSGNLDSSNRQILKEVILIQISLPDKFCMYLGRFRLWSTWHHRINISHNQRRNRIVKRRVFTYRTRVERNIFPSSPCTGFTQSFCLWIISHGSNLCTLDFCLNNSLGYPHFRLFLCFNWSSTPFTYMSWSLTNTLVC